MIEWLKFLHVGSVLAFLLAHGVQVTVMWRQRWEADPAKNLAFFEVLPSVRLVRGLAGAIVVSGFLLVARLSAWDRAWMWLSVIILAAIWGLMLRFGGSYYSALEEAAARVLEARGTDTEAAAAEAWDRARLGWQPVGLTVIGIAGLAAILWLMIFRPF